MDESAALDDVIAELDATERGFVVGVMAFASAERAAIVEALLGSAGVRCAHALVALESLPRGRRAQAVADLGREVLAPVPSGIEKMHASWIREALADESPLALALVANDPDMPRDVVALARKATKVEKADKAQPRQTRQVASSADSVSPRHATELKAAVFAGLVAIPGTRPSEAARSAEASPQRLARRLALLDGRALTAEMASLGGAREVGRRLGVDEREDDAARAVAQRLPLEDGRALLEGAGLVSHPTSPPG